MHPQHLLDREHELFKDWLTGLLESTVIVVTFQKKDGTTRVMKCTLKPDSIPPVVVKEGKEPRKQSDTTVVVYDLEAEGWRSFALKSIISIDFPL